MLNEIRAFHELIALADEGVKLQEHNGGRGGTPFMGQLCAWVSEVDAVKIEDVADRIAIKTSLGVLEKLPGTAFTKQDVTNNLSVVISGLRRAAKDLAGQSDEAKRLTLLHEFYLANQKEAGAVLTQNSLAADFCVDIAVTDRWIKSLTEDGLLKYGGPGDHGDRLLGITTDGIDFVQVALTRDSIAIVTTQERWGSYPPTEVDDTGLIRKKGFKDDLKFAFETADEAAPLCLLFIDLDEFKKVNDEGGGHLVGDKVLSCVGEVCRDVTNRRGRVYRYGGDELTILLPGFHSDEGIAIAERIRKTIYALDFDLGWHVSVSIGVADSSVDGVNTTDELISRADKAVYRAKNAGRNRVEGPALVAEDE